MHRRVSSWGGIRALAACAAAAVVACSTPDGAVSPAPRTDAGQYWALTLDRRAVTLSTVAPYDTIRLTATPRDGAGNPISGLSRPIYTSSDLQSAAVDSDGVVHALAPAGGIVIVASLTADDHTFTDTAMIAVTDTATPPVLATLTIHPDSGDSAMAPVDMPRVLVARMADPGGNALDGLEVRYASADPHVAAIDPWTGAVQGVYPGRVNLIATATAYGKTLADTVSYVIGYPSVAQIQAVPRLVAGATQLAFEPASVTIGTSGVVTFSNPSTSTMIDAVFDDSTQVGESWTCAEFLHVFFPWACGTGNIAPFQTDTTEFLSGIRQRGFPAGGTFTYHSTLFPTSGTIVVVDWRTIQ